MRQLLVNFMISDKIEIVKGMERNVEKGQRQVGIEY